MISHWQELTMVQWQQPCPGLKCIKFSLSITKLELPSFVEDILLIGLAMLEQCVMDGHMWEIATFILQTVWIRRCTAESPNNVFLYHVLSWCR